MFETLEILREGEVATVWLNRPERHNAFDALMIAELTRAFATLGADDSVRAMVLAGRGNSFCAGADLAWMKTAGEADFEDNLSDARKLARMLRVLAEMPKPTLARVHGASFGGGMGLAAACDICIAADSARFATSEVRFGLIPSAIAPYVLRAIGARQAGRFFLTAEGISAQQAREIGLAHEVVEAEALDACVQRQLDMLLKGGPMAQAEAKRLIRDMAGHGVDDTIMEETARRIANLRGSAEAREGVSAFLEKRPPCWSR